MNLLAGSVAFCTSLPAERLLEWNHRVVFIDP